MIGSSDGGDIFCGKLSCPAVDQMPHIAGINKEDSALSSVSPRGRETSLPLGGIEGGFRGFPRNKPQAGWYLRIQK